MSARLPPPKRKAAMHVEMGAAYKKVGGSLIEKLHFDTHCDKLANLYKQIAKEDAALAKAHEVMAKEGEEATGGVRRG